MIGPDGSSHDTTCGTSTQSDSYNRQRWIDYVDKSPTAFIEVFGVEEKSATEKSHKIYFLDY